MIVLPTASDEWIKQCLGYAAEPVLLFADASFRSYYRISVKGKTSLVLMYAPPEHESLASYVQIATNWRKIGINTPKVWFDNQLLGLALVEDFGDNHLLTASSGLQAYWYELAVKQLLLISASPLDGLPDFYANIYHHEMQLLPEWAVPHFKLDFDQQGWEQLTVGLFNRLKSMPQASCHRDFHSRNIMCLVDPIRAIGVLDFQDAAKASRTYDLASLVFDVYTDLPDDLTAKHIQTCASAWQVDFSEIKGELLLTGLQRLLKIYGIFCRLNTRDNKPTYLNYLPRASRRINSIYDALLAAGETWLEPHLSLIRSLRAAVESSSCVR